MTQLLPTSENKKHHNWKALFSISVFSAYFYAFMEWLFFATEPSSLSILSPFESVEVLAVTAGVFALTLVIGSVILSLPDWLVNSPKWRSRLLVLSYIPEALLLSITELIMLDNLTFTAFKFGVISLEGLWRAVYAFGFVAFFWGILHFLQRTAHRNKKPTFFLALGLLTVSMAGILAIRLSNGLSPGTYPNIIILGSDGLSANYLSVYGYPLKTTPFLNEVAKTSLVAENA